MNALLIPKLSEFVKQTKEATGHAVRFESKNGTHYTMTIHAKGDTCSSKRLTMHNFNERLLELTDAEHILNAVNDLFIAWRAGNLKVLGPINIRMMLYRTILRSAFADGPEEDPFVKYQDGIIDAMAKLADKYHYIQYHATTASLAIRKLIDCRMYRSKIIKPKGRPVLRTYTARTKHAIEHVLHAVYANIPSRMPIELPPHSNARLESRTLDVMEALGITRDTLGFMVRINEIQKQLAGDNLVIDREIVIDAAPRPDNTDDRKQEKQRVNPVPKKQYRGKQTKRTDSGPKADLRPDTMKELELALLSFKVSPESQDDKSNFKNHKSSQGK